jgi:hypothetical protein
MKHPASELLSKLRKEKAWLQSFFSSLSEEDWRQQIYESGMGWKVRDILAHMISAERAFQWLITRAVQGKEGVGADFDIDAFNREESSQYASHSPDQLLNMLDAVREDTNFLVENLKLEDFDLRSYHPWYGDISIEELLTFILGHNLQHIRDTRKVMRTGKPLPTESN